MFRIITTYAFDPHELHGLNILMRGRVAPRGEDVSDGSAFAAAVINGWETVIERIFSISPQRVVLEDAFAIAARRGQVGAMEQLLARGAKNFRLAAYHAAAGGSTGALEFMLKENLISPSMALTCAAEAGRADIIKFATQKGGDGFDVAFMAAVRNEQTHVLGDLAKMGISQSWWNSTFVEAASGGRTAALQWMIDTKRTDLLWRNKALEEAAGAGRVAAMEALISSGATWVSFALQRAVDGGHIDAAKMAIAHGARYEQKHLSRARKLGHSDLATFLTGLLG